MLGAMETRTFGVLTVVLGLVGSASAQSMTAAMRIGGDDPLPKPGDTVGVYRARSQTYLVPTSADRAAGVSVTFLPKTTYVFETESKERYRKYLRSERLLLPTAGFFVEALRRDTAGVQGSVLGAGLSVRTVQALREGGKRADLALYSGLSLGFWRTEAEGQRAQRGGSRLFLGVETRQGLVLEVAYSDRPTVGALAPRGGSVSLGVRF